MNRINQITRHLIGPRELHAMNSRQLAVYIAVLFAASITCTIALITLIYGGR
jgi:hypothetical protein